MARKSKELKLNILIKQKENRGLHSLLFLGGNMYYIFLLVIFFITLGLMYGEARYTQGRNDLAEELIEKISNEKHGE